MLPQQRHSVSGLVNPSPQPPFPHLDQHHHHPYHDVPAVPLLTISFLELHMLRYVSVLVLRQASFIPANVPLAGEWDDVHRKRVIGEVYLHLCCE